MIERFRKKPPKDTSSLAYKKYMANKLDGHHIEYSLEKIDNVETVIGKNGAINVRNGELILTGSGETLFRVRIENLSAWEFMSLNGVVMTGYDIEHQKERTIIAYYSYYSYYRK